MLMEQVETSVSLLMSFSWAKRKNEVSMPCVRKTVTTPAMEYQSTKGADSVGEKSPRNDGCDEERKYPHQY